MRLAVAYHFSGVCCEERCKSLASNDDSGKRTLPGSLITVPEPDQRPFRKWSIMNRTAPQYTNRRFADQGLYGCCVRRPLAQRVGLSAQASAIQRSARSFSGHPGSASAPQTPGAQPRRHSMDLLRIPPSRAPRYLAFIWQCNKPDHTATKCNTIWGRSDFTFQKSD
jgi:hypothetical protein